MELESIISLMNKKKTEAVNAEFTEGVLSINCRVCTSVPDVRSPGCLRCIIQKISEQGNAERIRLRTSKDVEIFGSAADTLCELAALYGSTAINVQKEENRACSNCNNSCSKIMDILWAGFPDLNFDSARGRLASFHPSDNKCNVCLQRTYRALEQAEHGMNNLKKKISVEAARTGGV